MVGKPPLPLKSRVSPAVGAPVLVWPASMPDRAGQVGTCFSLTLGPCSSSTTWGKVGTSRRRLGTMAMQGMVAGAHLADCRYERGCFIGNIDLWRKHCKLHHASIGAR